MYPRGPGRGAPSGVRWVWRYPLALDDLGPARRARLSSDLALYGGRAVGLTRAETAALVGDAARGAVLHAWLRTHGTADPERTAPPVRRPRTPRRAPTGAVAGAVSGATHLVVGDCHAAPGQDLARFSELGRLVGAEADRAGREGRTLRVVQIGDWYSFDSLCTHESARQRGEGRVVEEIAAGEAALVAYHEALGRTPEHVEHYLTLGNHDVRVARLGDDAPWLDGLYSVGAAHEARGWRVAEYLRPLRLDGVRYQHYLTGRGGSRAIGGVNHARALLARVQYGESVVVGHSHTLAYATEASHLGVRRHAIVAGCWLDHVEEYAGEDNASWWVGHVVLRDVREGVIGSVEFHERAPAPPAPRGRPG